MKLTMSAALAGLADTAAFAATRRDALMRNPQRTGGTLVSLGMWAALAQSAAAGDRRRARRVAAVTVLANSAMLAVHLHAGVASPRVYAGAALAAAALAGTFLGD